VLLTLKLLLAPSLVGGVSLLGRVLGPQIAGFLGALPIIAGPIVYFITDEQGPLFGATSARACALGSAATTLFAVGFVCVPNLAWWGAALVGYLGFAVGVLLLSFVPVTLYAALLIPAAMHFAFLRWTERAPVLSSRRALPSWDLPLRMLLTALLVLLITSIAAWAGARWSGLLTPFPVATVVLSSFAHAQDGAPSAKVLLRGLVLGLNTFMVFFVVLSELLPRLSTPWAFAVAAFVAACVHLGIAFRMGRGVSK